MTATSVVLASHNTGKLRELSATLQPLGAQLVLAGELGIEAPEEPAGTFIENALIKARHSAAAANLPALADDSGLVVPALGGAPGVHSARYAGAGATDADNNVQLLRALRGVDARDAYYYCALVFLRTADDPAPVIATARWHGRIVDEPRGSGGFGYDPYFWIPERGVTSAELQPAVKNALSHRGRAADQLVAELIDTAALG